MNSSRPSAHAGQRRRELALLGRAGARRRLGARGAVAGGRGNAADQVLVELADAAQVVADHGDAGRVDLFEQRPSGQLDLAVHARPELAGGRRRGDQHAPAVAGVGHPVGVAVALHAVEHGGDRPGSQAALFGELAGGDATAPVEDADTAQIGAVEAELRGHGFVQAVGRAAQLTELDADVVDQLLCVFCHAAPRCG